MKIKLIIIFLIPFLICFSCSINDDSEEEVDHFTCLEALINFIITNISSSNINITIFGIDFDEL